MVILCVFRNSQTQKHIVAAPFICFNMLIVIATNLQKRQVAETSLKEE